MNFRERQRAQSRHRRLGTLVVVSSGFCGAVSAWSFGLFVPIPIPFAPLIFGAFVAIVVYGILKKILGYDERKASAQQLKGDFSSKAELPSHLVPAEPVFDNDSSDPAEPPDIEQTPESLSAATVSTIVTCPQCGMKVVPKADGSCPSCQSVSG